MNVNGYEDLEGVDAVELRDFPRACVYESGVYFRGSEEKDLELLVSLEA